MAMLTIKAKPSVPPPNYAVHDEGEMLGGVIGRDSPRCLNTYGNVTFCG